MHREDFPMLKEDIIYFDNGATTLKPYAVLQSMNDYYEHYSANAHRGDYKISHKVDTLYEETREKVKNFLNAARKEEIIFTAGATDSLNQIIHGYFGPLLKEGDEVLITKSEHASNVLPWFEVAKSTGCIIKYIPLNEEYKVTLENVKNSITEHTKVISLAQVTNVIGDVRPIKEISRLVHEHNILMVVDGAQSVPHMKVDVQDLDIDFLAFSSHKMCGPTGVGVLYGKYELLDQLHPTNTGGGMNASFASDGSHSYHLLPTRLEAGTPNIAGVLGLGAAVDYLQTIGMDVIHSHEANLKAYFLKKIKQIDKIKVYNKTSDTGIITFNIEDIFSQDLSFYLDKHNICVRAGNHCAKMLQEVLGIKNTCRVSFYFYNTIEEIDTLIDVLSNKEIVKEIF